MPSLDRQLILTHFKLFLTIKSQIKLNTNILNLTFVQLNALIFINEKKNPQVNELAKHFRVAMPTATVLVDKLSSIGLVRREEDLRDRRITHLVLTKKAEKLLKSAMRERESMLTRVFARLSRKDKRDFLRIMNNIIQN